jgi:hypothetical protein
MWKTAAFAVVIALGVGFAVTVAAGEKEEDETECDLANVVKMHYCETDEVALKKDQLVSDKKYLICEDCAVTAEKKGDCPHCEGKVVEKVSGKNVCPICYGKVGMAEICVKEYYECPGCDARSAKAGKCKECKKDLVKKTSHAAIEYWCGDCGFSSRKPGNCPEKTCKAEDRKLIRSCEESGDFPHVKKSAGK